MTEYSTAMPRYLVDLQEQGGEWTGTVPGFSSLSLTAPTRDKLIAQFPTYLRDELNSMRIDGKTLPVAIADPAALPTKGQALIEPLDDQYSEKAAEKLVDFAKAEYDRTAANAKLAEDRARANGALALAVIPVIAFLRPAEADQLLVIGILVVVLGMIVLTLLSVWTRTVSGIGFSPAELETERDAIYNSKRTTRDMLYLIQDAWSRGYDQINQIANDRFRYVKFQQAGLVLLTLLLGILTWRTLLQWDMSPPDKKQGIKVNQKDDEGRGGGGEATTHKESSGRSYSSPPSNPQKPAGKSPSKTTSKPTSKKK